MNRLYEQYNRGPADNFVQRFLQFKNTFNGNPQQIVQQMLNSGKITQEQFNNAVRIANQFTRLMK